MPRRRTSNRPLKRRIKLETQQDVQSELGKVYRAVDRSDMSPAEGTRRVFMLDKLRASGLPDARAKAGGGYAAPVINVFSVPSGYFLNHRADRGHNRGEQIIDVNDCKQLALEPEPQLPMLEVSEPVTIEIDAAPGDPTVVDFPAARFRKPDDGDHAA